MKKVAAFLGALLILAIAGALIAPFFIDLNDYKPEIAEQAKAATGRDLAIERTGDRFEFGRPRKVAGGHRPNLNDRVALRICVPVPEKHEPADTQRS